MSLAMPGPAVAAKRERAWNPFAPVTRWTRRYTAPLAAWTNRNPRRAIVVSIAVVCGCLCGAVMLAAYWTYAGVRGDAEDYARAQARVLAAETGHTLDRLAAMSVNYLNAVDEPSARAVIAAQANVLTNIALADASGRFISAMHGEVLQAHPLPAEAVKRALRARVAGAYGDPAIGKSALLVMFRADKEIPARFVVVLIDPAALVPAYAIGGGALLSPEGAPLALSPGWASPPPAYALRTDRRGSDIRYIGDARGGRLVALTPVPGWPIAAAASVATGEAFSGWYAALPLYVFLLLAIAMIGVGVARILLQRQARAARPLEHELPEALMNHAKATALKTRLADAEKRSLEAERAKVEFLAHMSHELRTPLNAIVGFAEIIESDLYGPKGREKYTEYAGDIARAARALHARIGEILEVAAMAADQHELAGDSTDAVAVARACADQVRGFAHIRNIKLDANLPPLPQVTADPTAIKRILIVLLSNALRFTKDGGSVVLDARKFDHEVILTVHDSGSGAPAEGVPVALSSTERLGTRERDRSYGLGLAMATGLARRMGGTLRISGTATGATAELRLPVAAAAPAEAAPSPPRAKRANL